MILSWLKSRRRKKRMAAPFPEPWLAIIQRNVKHYALLSPQQQLRIRQYVAAFVPEKYWEGCGGQEMNDEVRVTIAALVGVMMLGIEPPYFFDQVKSILVYPSTYLQPEHTIGAVGGNVALVEEDVDVLGEAWSEGPVILSWDAVLEGGRRRFGHNVVFHEFAHCLDRLDGATDGTPTLVYASTTGDNRGKLVPEGGTGAGSQPVARLLKVVSPTEIIIGGLHATDAAPAAPAGG